MSAAALFDTTLALARRIRQATRLEVHIGSPLKDERNAARVVLSLVNLQPNAALRNTPRFGSPPASGPVTAPAPLIDAVPFDLHYLITCYRPPTAAGVAPPEPGELVSLGQIIALLHSDPALTGASLPGQDVRLSPLSLGTEEMNRIWSLFPDEPYRASIVYLATPVYVEVGDAALYPPIQSREMDGGLAQEEAA